MHEIQVSVVSPEEASCIEPRDDGAAVVVGARGLLDALAEANRLLATY